MFDEPKWDPCRLSRGHVSSLLNPSLPVAAQSRMPFALPQLRSEVNALYEVSVVLFCLDTNNLLDPRRKRVSALLRMIQNSLESDLRVANMLLQSPFVGFDESFFLFSEATLVNNSHCNMFELWELLERQCGLQRRRIAGVEVPIVIFIAMQHSESPPSDKLKLGNDLTLNRQQLPQPCQSIFVLELEDVHLEGKNCGFRVDLATDAEEAQLILRCVGSLCIWYAPRVPALVAVLDVHVECRSADHILPDGIPYLTRQAQER